MFRNIGDRTVWIVAGGPSLRNFDFDHLRNTPHIAINRAVEDCRHASIVYWSDTRVWAMIERFVRMHPGMKCAGIDVHKTEYPFWVSRYRFDGITGLSLEPGTLRSGNNSGYAAINLAAQLGAKRIGLLGYDMKLDGHRDHYHSGYPNLPIRERTLKEKMLPHFKTLVDPLRKLRVEVINYNEDSAIDCFEKKPLEEARFE